MTHSAIWGPWIPEHVVRGMEVDVYIGCEEMWSVPAEKK